MAELAEQVPINIHTPVYLNSNGYCKYGDAELVRRCLNGEELAWIALLERYGSFIYSIAVKFNLPLDDVAYIFQTVFFTMLENLESLKDEPRLSAWLATVTLWQCRQLVEPEHGEREISDRADSSFRLYQDIQQLERERLVHQAVSIMEAPARQQLASLVEDLTSDATLDEASHFPVPATAAGLN